MQAVDEDALAGDDRAGQAAAGQVGLPADVLRRVLPLDAAGPSRRRRRCRRARGTAASQRPQGGREKDKRRGIRNNADGHRKCFIASLTLPLVSVTHFLSGMGRFRASFTELGN